MSIFHVADLASFIARYFDSLDSILQYRLVCKKLSKIHFLVHFPLHKNYPFLSSTIINLQQNDDIYDINKHNERIICNSTIHYFKNRNIFSQIYSLDLSKIHCFHDQIKHIKYLHNLQFLNCGRCTLITDSVLQELTELRYLICGSSNYITNKSILQLKKLKQLYYYSKNNINITTIINNITSLKYIRVIDNVSLDYISNISFGDVNNMNNVETFIINSYTPFQHEYYNHFNNLKEISLLTFSDESMHYYQYIKNITKLTYINTVMDDNNDVRLYSIDNHVSNLPFLKHIDISSSKKYTISESLPSLKYLTKLYLYSDFYINDYVLSQLTTLQVLNIRKVNKITDNSISLLTSLHTLVIKYCFNHYNKISDNGIRCLTSLENLMILPGSNITDKAFINTTTLQNIHCDSQYISDVTLQKNINLTDIKLTGTGNNITKKAVQQLKKLKHVTIASLSKIDLIDIRYGILSVNSR